MMHTRIGRLLRTRLIRFLRSSAMIFLETVKNSNMINVIIGLFTIASKKLWNISWMNRSVLFRYHIYSLFIRIFSRSSAYKCATKYWSIFTENSLSKNETSHLCLSFSVSPKIFSMLSNFSVCRTV